MAESTSDEKDEPIQKEGDPTIDPVADLKQWMSNNGFTICDETYNKLSTHGFCTMYVCTCRNRTTRLYFKFRNLQNRFKAMHSAGDEGILTKGAYGHQACRQNKIAESCGDAGKQNQNNQSSGDSNSQKHR